TSDCGTEDAKEVLHSPLRLLANGKYRGTALIVLILSVGVHLPYTFVRAWLPTIMNVFFEGLKLSEEGVVKRTGDAVMLFSFGSFFGFLLFGYFADWLGRRLAIGLFNVLALVIGLWLFMGPQALESYAVLLPAFGFLLTGPLTGQAT